MKRLSGKMGKAVVNSSGGSCGSLLWVILFIIMLIALCVTIVQAIERW